MGWNIVMLRQACHFALKKIKQKKLKDIKNSNSSYQKTQGNYGKTQFTCHRLQLKKDFYL